MKASEMRRGDQYRLKDGKIVECYGYLHSGKYAIVHPPGEADMQSCFGIPMEEEVEHAAKEAT